MFVGVPTLLWQGRTFLSCRSRPKQVWPRSREAPISIEERSDKQSLPNTAPRTFRMHGPRSTTRPVRRARRENRVLTVRHPNGGTKRDVGVIGFKQAPLSSYLIFPRPLQADKDLSVIGINYLLIDEDVPSDSK
jgi:hypothetical protein